MTDQTDSEAARQERYRQYYAEQAAIQAGSMNPQPQPPDRKWYRPGWRKFTWAIVVVNVLFVILLISSIASSNHQIAKDCVTDPYLTQQECSNASHAGQAIGVGIVLFMWFLIDGILGVIWLVTRGRSCPVCGQNVRKGLTSCRSCGTDFRYGMAAR